MVSSIMGMSGSVHDSGGLRMMLRGDSLLVVFGPGADIPTFFASRPSGLVLLFFTLHTTHFSLDHHNTRTPPGPWLPQPSHSPPDLFRPNSPLPDSPLISPLHSLLLVNSLLGIHLTRKIPRIQSISRACGYVCAIFDAYLGIARYG